MLEGAAKHSDRNFILVIPEQSSISAQKDIIDMSPNHGILNIDILSFNRLAHRIFEVTGGEASDLIDDSGKNLIIRHIADSIGDDLKVLRGELKKSGYVAEIRSVISEFMQYGIAPEDMFTIAEDAGRRSPYLSRKLEDVALIYKRFKEYMGSDFMTREELLVKAAAEAHNAPFLQSSTLIFDSFTGFTPVQYTFIEALLTRCEDIYVSVTRTGDDRGGLFRLGDTTFEKLDGLAERHGGLDVISLKQDVRHKKTSDIAALGLNIFETLQAPSGDRDDSVSFYKADEPYAETREALRRIVSLVREQGYHYRECGILMGDTALYADIVRSEAFRLGIPVYVDQTRHIRLNPFTELIRAVILVIKENYSYDSVFHLLRTGLTDIETDAIDLAENYILGAGVRGRSAYGSPFTIMFKGLSEEGRVAAESIRTAVNKLLSPLIAVMDKGGSAKVLDIIAAVRDICEAVGAKEKLEEFVKYFEENAAPERAIEYSQIYDILNNQFDNMVSLIGEQEVTIKEFSELYEDALSEIRVGVIPPKSDVVMAGDLTRSRFSHIRALFFIGMTEGTIPAPGNKGGLISDSDRQILGSLGIEVAPTAAENAERERFYFYMNLMKPSERVCFSYPEKTLDGGVNRESYFIKEARRCLGDDAAGTVTEDENIYSKDELLDRFAESLRDDPEAAALYLKAAEAGASHPAVASDMEAFALSLIRISAPEERLDKDAGELLFGQGFIESPTELESFAACPYGHFLDYGLRLRERRSFEFEMRDIGTLLHKVLEIFSRKLAEERLTFRSVSDDKAVVMLEAALDKAAEDTGRIASLITSGARYAHAFERLRKYAYRSIDTLRFQARAGAFDNIYFERRFNIAGLKGTIDRSDEAVTDNGIFIDIIDYKTGNKTFDPDRIYNGLDIQLPLYMYSALEMRTATSVGKTVRPAGLFYYHVDDPLIEGTKTSPEDEITKAIHKELRLRGVVNSDMEAIRAFDREITDTGKSLVIPAGFKKDGTPEASAKLYTEGQLNGMIEHTLELTDSLRRRIVGGEVARSPYSLGDRTGCDYCVYREICDGGRRRVLSKQSFPEAWESI